MNLRRSESGFAPGCYPRAQPNSPLSELALFLDQVAEPESGAACSREIAAPSVPRIARNTPSGSRSRRGRGSTLWRARLRARPKRAGYPSVAMPFLLLAKSQPVSTGQTVCSLLLVVGVCALVGIYKVSIYLQERREEERKRRRIREAESSYRDALARLSERQDSEWKTYVLELGRHLASLQREYGVATVYDEVSIMNDVSAATPAPKPGALAKPPKDESAVKDWPSSAPTVKERLQNLKGLVEEGLITTADYEARKGEILREV